MAPRLLTPLMPAAIIGTVVPLGSVGPGGTSAELMMAIIVASLAAFLVGAR